MKPYPIILPTPQVRAALRGELECIVTTKGLKDVSRAFAHDGIIGDNESQLLMFSDPHGECIVPILNPFLVGRRLWVRETWKPTGLFAYATPSDTRACGRFAYYADTEQLSRDEFLSWRSASQMPQWASRLSLEVTASRVCRMGEVTEEEAKGYGVEHLNRAGTDVSIDGEVWTGAFKAALPHRWNESYKSDPWHPEKWCMVVEVRRV